MLQGCVKNWRKYKRNFLKTCPFDIDNDTYLYYYTDISRVFLFSDARVDTFLLSISEIVFVVIHLFLSCGSPTTPTQSGRWTSGGIETVGLLFHLFLAISPGREREKKRDEMVVGLHLCCTASGETLQVFGTKTWCSFFYIILLL